MGKRKIISILSAGSLFVLIAAAVIIVQILTASPAAAQTQTCVDPFTGAECTPTPTSPTCGLPGLPPCNPAPNNPPAPTRAVIVPPTHTPTPTNTPTPTVTPTPTSTITPIPTATPFPLPNPPPANPLKSSIANLVGLLHLPDPIVAKLPPWMTPYNIQLTDLEITQAIQCLHNPNCPDNSVPLYSGKTTMVRAYLRLTAGPGSFVNGISGALCYGNTGATGCANPVLSTNKAFVVWTKDPVTNSRWIPNLTVNFILPDSFVTGGTSQTITVYVNYKLQDLPSESPYSDNYKTLTYQVTQSQPIYVKFYPVQDKGYFPPASEWSTLAQYLTKTYPTGEFYPSIGFPLFSKDYDWTTADPWGCPKGWHDLINDLWYMRGGSGPIAFGEVPYQSLSGSVTGCGALGGPEAAGIAGTYDDGHIAAQEVGHTLNLPHVPGCGAGGPDMNYPSSVGLIDETGIDPITKQVYPPYWAYDFMGYCGGATNTWVSMYTYNEIAGLLPSGAYAPPHLASLNLILPAGQVLVGSGNLSPKSASLSQGFYLLDRTSFNTLTPDLGPYTVEMQNGAGSVLYSQHFDVAQLSNDTPQSEGGFQLVLPWADGTKKVVFKYQDKIIGQMTASANPPTLTLTSPKGGEAWAATGQQTITWSASDADHNTLSYMVQYSADGGQTWSMLAANLKDPTFTFDGDYLPGSDHGVIRVIATDGFNTVHVDSNQITVAAKAPVIAITSPTEAASFEAGTPVILQAVGTDLLDGPITDNKQFTWSADNGVSLGTGNPLILSNLSEGSHSITLTVQNTNGLVATASVQITITPPAKPVGTNGLSLGDFMPLILIFLITAAVIVVAVLAIRRSRARKV